VIRRAALAALLLLATPAVVLAQEGPVTVRSEVDRTAMSIGDQIVLTVTVDLAPGHELETPGVPRAVGDFEVVDTLTVLQTRSTSGATRVVLRYLITAFELGRHEIPPIVVGYRGPAGPGEATAPSGHTIGVRSVIGADQDASDIRPLKAPLPIPGTGGELLPRALAAGAIVVLLAVAAALALRVRRMPAIAEAPAHGPARRALDELERISELRLAEQGRTREHYELVSAALRAFLTERYGLPARSRTARELRRELERGGVDRTHAHILYEALADAEAVRYQARVIYPARAQKTMRDVTDVVRKSVVAEEYELVRAGAGA